MNIQQATKIATKQKRGITRKSWGPRSVTILPTNTANGCLLLFFGRKHEVKSNWEPTALDLLANDWEVQG
ncbi:DUF2829 domain-containing protein [Latilactobacillus curvatus]|uniref:Thoeris anti-defense Tad2 family protein n=1 Tax=Latilactobacillus curvatus TaxID=28038 RepID=UPI0020C78CC1|nr:MW1434 family type I TA system toxin [Latilactobacillus curvatus]MCP8849151.1 DUF2829 domain-containing protein [Latilactobacillus curvatus]